MIKQLFLLITLGAILAGCAPDSATPGVPTLAGVTRKPPTEAEGIAHPTEPDLTTPELIDAALARGEITEGERWLFLTYAVYEPGSLPEAYQSRLPWRGTLIVRDIKQFATTENSFCTLTPEIQHEIQRLIPESVSCPP